MRLSEPFSYKKITFFQNGIEEETPQAKRNVKYVI